MSKAPFSCVLSDDKSEMKLVAQAGEFKYSAAEVEELALFFGKLRAQMSPAIPERSGDVVALEGDRWEIYQKPQDGSARLYFRLPGLGWSFIHLEEDMAVGLSGVLNPKKLIPRTPQNQ
jgi:hypothetical protein